MTQDRQRGPADDRLPQWAERLVLFLDDGLVVPGTNFRVGFDAILGLVPGVGDFVTTASSLSLIWLAQQRGVPKAVLARMLFNLGIDALIGAVPVLGDAFDLVFKANRRNLALLERYERSPKESAVHDAFFLVLIVIGVVLLLTVPFVLAMLIVELITG